MTNTLTIMSKILFIDMVTTGIGPETNRYGIYRMGGILTEDGVERERFELKIRPFPGARIVDSSLWVTGSSRSELLYSEEEGAAFMRFIDLLDSHVNVRNAADKLVIAGFNAASLDVPFLKELFRRNDNPHFRDYFRYQCIDIASVCAFSLMKGRPDLKDFHLESAARSLGVVPSHGDGYSCIDNAKTCLDIYRRLSVRFGIAGVPDLTTASVTKNF